MSELKAANFNAAFPLMCGPDSAKYRSEFAPQATERDHMKECLDAARRHGIEVHVWKANWQVLSGTSKEAQKKFADQHRFVVSLEQALGQQEKGSYQWSTRWLDPSDDRNRQLEYDMMMELVQKYHPHGIHFDFMRYPENSYCYCDRCRSLFEQWAGVRVAQWPQDCAGKGTLAEKFHDWRRHLQTSLVKRIAEGARRIDPNVKISLAARASMTGSYDSDAQDWVTWAKQGYLDFLCPMDYYRQREGAAEQAPTPGRRHRRRRSDLRRPGRQSHPILHAAESLPADRPVAPARRRRLSRVRFVALLRSHVALDPPRRNLHARHRHAAP